MSKIQLADQSNSIAALPMTYTFTYKDMEFVMVESAAPNERNHVVATIIWADDGSIESILKHHGTL